jgi:hypothetical protein
VDFTRLQLVNIYDRDNFYRTRPPQHSSPPYNPDPAHWPDTPSYRGRGKTVMTVRQEAGNEDILGPDNTAGGQWDSWFAVFGPRGSRGHPAALFDPASGAIDRAVVEQYKAYDLGHLLRAEPGRYGPILRGNVRLIVGDADDFFLNEAVTLLKTDLERLCPPDPALPGYIKVLPGRTHGSVLATPEARAFPAEMLAHLRAAAILPASGR